MAVTIKQIAELANVSRGTVDKVLNKRPGVKAETRERVLKIAKELDYKPNFLGKALVQHKEKTKIGIILTPEYNPFIQEMILGIHEAEAEFRAFGIEVTIKILNSIEPAEQIGILNNFEHDNYAGIAVFPLDDPQVVAKINDLSAKGIAIITFNSHVEAVKSFCFVGQDHYKGGRTAAGLLDKIVHRPGEIAVIISSNHLSCHRDRLQGFKDKLEELAKPYKIVDVVENYDKKEDAFRITLELINEYPQLKAIYITGGGVSGLASALSLSEASKDIKVISHDLTTDAKELLEKGSLDFVIGQNPELQGNLLVKILFELLIKRQKPVHKSINVPIEIISSDSF